MDLAQLDVTKIGQRIQDRLAKEANAGCGLIYELYAVRYSDAVDRFIKHSPIGRQVAPVLKAPSGDYVNTKDRGAEEGDYFGNCFFCGKPLTMGERAASDACYECMND